MNGKNIIVSILHVFILTEVPMTRSIAWDRMPCAKDPDQVVPDGTVANIGRFPWLGVVQHNFYIGGATHFAVTMGVLIHPSYAISPAEDIARILHDQILNNTKFIIWYSESVKYAIDVVDYVVHPEYKEINTVATIALLELDNRGETTFGENSEAVLPVCLPVSGVDSPFTEMFAVKITDETAEIQKEAYKMKYVNDSECSDFYLNNKLTHTKMAPVKALCAKTDRQLDPCVWDGGVALITSHSWGLWKLLGFSVRGPGCGAPARFLIIHEYLSWITETMTQPVSDEEMEEEEIGIGFRRLSPIKIIMYKAKDTLPKDIGVCDRKERGNVMFKDAFEILATKDFGQGFFYVIIHQITQFTCAIVNYEVVSAKSNAAIWVEHYCYKELTGVAHGQKKPKQEARRDCFAYFKTAAYIQFRFYFSFKAKIEVTIYGKPEVPRIMPDPFALKETTDLWYPTLYWKLEWDSFMPIVNFFFRWYL